MSVRKVAFVQVVFAFVLVLHAACVAFNQPWPISFFQSNRLSMELGRD